MGRLLTITAALAFAAMLGSVAPAFATAYTFTQLHGDGSLDPSTQLSVDVQSAGADAVSFTFYNDVGQKSSITDIYFTGTGGYLLLPGAITGQSDGVSFSIGADPWNLPGGTYYDFVATVGADSNPPVQKNGINSASEWVTWTFSLASGASYQSVISAIETGTLRLGLLVPGYSGGSSSFINSCGLTSCAKTPAVPLPASLWLMFGALGGLAGFARLKRGRAA